MFSTNENKNNDADLRTQIRQLFNVDTNAFNELLILQLCSIFRYHVHAVFNPVYERNCDLECVLPKKCDACIRRLTEGCRKCQVLFVQSDKDVARVQHNAEWCPFSQNIWYLVCSKCKLNHQRECPDCTTQKIMTNYEWRRSSDLLQESDHSYRFEWCEAARIYDIKPEKIIKVMDHTTCLRVWKVNKFLNCYAPLSIQDWDEQEVFDKLIKMLKCIAELVTLSCFEEYKLYDSYNDQTKDQICKQTQANKHFWNTSAFAMLYDLVMLYHVVIEKKHRFDSRYRRRWMEINQYIYMTLRVMTSTEAYKITIYSYDFTQPVPKQACLNMMYIPYTHQNIDTIELPSAYSVLNIYKHFPNGFVNIQQQYKVCYQLLMQDIKKQDNKATIIQQNKLFAYFYSDRFSTFLNSI